MVASANTVKYGDSVLLNITAVSLNPGWDNLTTGPLYFANILGGNLDAGINILLFPQYSMHNSVRQFCLCGSCYIAAPLLAERVQYLLVVVYCFAPDQS